MQNNLLYKTSEWTSTTKQILSSIQYLYKYHPFRMHKFYGNNIISRLFQSSCNCPVIHLISGHLLISIQQTGARSTGNMPS